MTGSKDVISDIETARVLIVANYASVRSGLHALLLGADGIRVLGETGSAGGDAFTRLLRDVRPDVVLLDAPDESTLGTSLSAIAVPHTVSPVREDAPALVALGSDALSDVPRLQAAPFLPGWAYLSRDADGPQIVSAIRAAAEGLVVLDRAAMQRISEITGPDSGPARSAITESDFPGETLTARETEVLQQMAQGLPNKIIATRLGISLHTAKFHVAQILGKLDATSRTEAVTIGARRGYVTF
ncbi:MAG: response regulator transcription factor [Cytophagales bacterium]|nr:response regulator transcription factor [Armatimonadota bacterium]